MNLILQRFSDNKNSTIGVMLEQGNKGENPIFKNFTLEDEFRLTKVRGETRIPAGTYEIKKRLVRSRLTLKYRERFEWFDWHLELQGVPDFNYVYIHIGNDEGDTDACLLVADECDNNMVKRGFIGNSKVAFERLYKEISRRMQKERIFIEVRDEFNLN